MGVIGDHDLLACKTKVHGPFPFAAARLQGKHPTPTAATPAGRRRPSPAAAAANNLSPGRPARRNITAEVSGFRDPPVPFVPARLAMAMTIALSMAAGVLRPRRQARQPGRRR
jgi:hypothetical protein